MKEIIVDCLGFEWDNHNRYKNEKHNVDWTECEEVFFQQPLAMWADKTHSKKEKRYFVLGQTKAGRKLFIAFTIKNKHIRVISARNMTKTEIKIYKEQ